jgi:hexokinase
MYLGEITRGIITALVDASPKSLLFNGKSTPAINKHYGIDTSFISAVEYAWLGDNTYSDSIDLPFTEFDNDVLSAGVKTRLAAVRKTIVKDLGFKEDQVSLKDAAVRFHSTPFLGANFAMLIHLLRQITRWLCSLVARRAAHLSGVAVAAVLIQTGHAVPPGESHQGLKDVNEKIPVGVDGR